MGKLRCPVSSCVFDIVSIWAEECVFCIYSTFASHVFAVFDIVNNWHLCGTCITLSLAHFAFLLHLYFSGLSNNVSAAAHSRAGASTRLCSFNPRQTAECSCRTEITTHYNTHIQGGFLATLVALHFTLVSKSVSQSVSRSFKLA